MLERRGLNPLCIPFHHFGSIDVYPVASHERWAPDISQRRSKRVSCYANNRQAWSRTLRVERSSTGYEPMRITLPPSRKDACDSTQAMVTPNPIASAVAYTEQMQGAVSHPTVKVKVASVVTRSEAQRFRVASVRGCDVQRLRGSRYEK